MRYRQGYSRTSITTKWPSAFARGSPTSREIEQTFAKFRQAAVKDFLTEYRDLRDANHVQAQVLERVARLYPEIFARLEACNVGHGNFIDPTVRDFDREVQFYLAYLEFAQKFKDAGLPLCYPEVSEHSKEVSVEWAYDVARWQVRSSETALPSSAVTSNSQDLNAFWL